MFHSPQLKIKTTIQPVLISRKLNEDQGGYSTDAWVERCGPGVETLTLFKTQFSDFPIPLKTECEIFRLYLRHLTQNQYRPFATLGLLLLHLNVLRSSKAQ